MTWTYHGDGAPAGSVNPVLDGDWVISGDLAVGGDETVAGTLNVVGALLSGAIASSSSIKERARSVAMGEWANLTPVLAASSGTFSSANIVNCRKMYTGKTLWITAVLGSCTISATPTSLTMLIPDSAVAANQMWGACKIQENATGDVNGAVHVAAGGTTIIITKDFVPTAFVVSAGNATFTFTFGFEIA